MEYIEKYFTRKETDKLEDHFESLAQKNKFAKSAISAMCSIARNPGRSTTSYYFLTPSVTKYLESWGFIVRKETLRLGNHIKAVFLSKKWKELEGGGILSHLPESKDSDKSLISFCEHTKKGLIPHTEPKALDSEIEIEDTDLVLIPNWGLSRDRNTITSQYMSVYTGNTFKRCNLMNDKGTKKIVLIKNYHIGTLKAQPAFIVVDKNKI